MRNRLRFVLCFLMLSMLLGGSLLSCGKVELDESDDQKINELIKRGKGYLSQSLYYDARVVFEDVLINHDRQNDQALFGWCLAKTLEAFNNLVNDLLSLVEYILPLLKEDPGAVSVALEKYAVERLGVEPSYRVVAGQQQAEMVQRSGIGMVIDGILDPLLIAITVMNDHLGLVKTNPNYRFVIDTLPIKIGPFVLANVGGEYDLGEVEFFSAAINALGGILDVVLSIDFSIDLVSTINLYIDNPEAFEEITADDVIALIVAVFRDNPELLGLEPDAGAALMIDAGAKLSHAFGDLAAGLVFIIAETDDQSDDIIKHALIEGIDTLQIKLDTTQNPFIEGEIDPQSLLSIPLNSEDINIIDTFLRISESFANSGVRISWATDFVPMISLAVVLILDTHLLDGVIESLLGELDPALAGTVNSILSQDIIDAGLIGNLLLGFVGDFFEFDFGTFFASPVGIRSLLPAWTSSGEGLEDTLILEWECAEESVTDIYICDDGVELSDSEHFYPDATTHFSAADFSAMSIDPIDQDGIESILPYIAFQSPSFNGMLYVDVHSLAGADSALDSAEEYKPASQLSLNALIAHLVGGLVGML
jgi:hypothetical protein